MAIEDPMRPILNLAHYHREHEKFYAQAPLEDAITIHRAARTLHALADRWTDAEATDSPVKHPFAGADDLNAPAALEESGVLFMEGEGEPAELTKLKRRLATLAEESEQTAAWLGNAMQSSWHAAASVIPIGPLADVLGERHRIIANDWQSANLNALKAHVLRRAIDILNAVELTPSALRADLRSGRHAANYLYAAAELLDHAGDLTQQSAMLVHDNERRWRVFRQRVQQLTAPAHRAE